MKLTREEVLKYAQQCVKEYGNGQWNYASLKMAEFLLQTDSVNLAVGKTGVIPGCGCEKCRPITLEDMRMILCPICGNKRCPHACDHGYVCTGSNEPGQLGSAYAESGINPKSCRPNEQNDVVQEGK